MEKPTSKNNLFDFSHEDVQSNFEKITGVDQREFDEKTNEVMNSIAKDLKKEGHSAAHAFEILFNSMTKKQLTMIALADILKKVFQESLKSKLKGMISDVTEGREEFKQSLESIMRDEGISLDNNED